MRLFKKTLLKRGGKPYLTRWTIISNRWFSIKLHKTVMSDPAHLHDHPWSYISIMLWGGYYERSIKEVKVMPTEENTFGWEIVKVPTRVWYGPGSILIRNASIPHSLEIPEGKYSLTLIFTSKKWRKWGFTTNDGWKSYEDNKTDY